MEDMLFVDYVSSFSVPNRNNRVYDRKLVEEQVKMIADRFAKQITINPWAENAVTTMSAVITCTQPHR